jgi:hypothetical protein
MNRALDCPAAPFNQASVPSRPYRLAHAADRLRGTAQNPHSFRGKSATDSEMKPAIDSDVMSAIPI